jgi:hypothetical protein
MPTAPFRLAAAALAVLITATATARDKAPPTAPQDPELRAALTKRMKAEQDARNDLQKLSPANRALTPADQAKAEVKEVLERMERVDKDNLAWLKGVVAGKGWPTKSMVGPDGALGAFLIAQHATTDLEFMNACLGHLKAAYVAGEAEGQWVALMTDRLLILREKKKHLYGTQLTAMGGRLVPQPIEDEANVDARRKELGMPPLAHYLELVNGGRPAKPAGGKTPDSPTNRKPPFQPVQDQVRQVR